MKTFHTAEAAIRVWVEREHSQWEFLQSLPGWRSQRIGERVLIFDTETTADYAQALLFGFFQVRERGKLCIEGIIIADEFSSNDKTVIATFATGHGLQVFTRTEFVEEIFYPEVYNLGSLCIAFNLPFDLSRIAIHAGSGRGKNRRSFRLTLDEDRCLPDIRIETISSKAAFVRFAPCRRRQRRFFQGRFLDLRSLVYAFTGEGKTLKAACEAFNTVERKSEFGSFGKVTIPALEYGRQDVRATWALYQELVAEYRRHPFATFENEHRPKSRRVPMTRLYSTASVGKAYLSQFGITPLLEKQPRFPRKVLGYAMASYFGGRAEVRIRLIDVPVTIVDFTSMYPTVFILQNLQNLLTARRIEIAECTQETQSFLDSIRPGELFLPTTWPKLNRLVKIKPSGEVLPVRCRFTCGGAFQISVTHYTCDSPAWYTLADCVAAILLGSKRPHILRALEFIPEDVEPGLRPVKFRGTTLIDPGSQIFKAVVEERQKAKRLADAGNVTAQRLADALKIFANSAAYGIYAEVNVSPPPQVGKHGGTVYGSTSFDAVEVHDEEPGRYCNPILATLTTGGARLMLALLEQCVAQAGGIHAFCDTDSLAIVSGDDCPPQIPCLSKDQIASIIDAFNSLNPYNPNIVRDLLKVELEDVRCLAVSAKRYVIFTRNGKEIKVL